MKNEPTELLKSADCSRGLAVYCDIIIVGIGSVIIRQEQLDQVCVISKRRTHWGVRGALKVRIYQMLF